MHDQIQKPNKSPNWWSSGYMLSENLFHIGDQHIGFSVLIYGIFMTVIYVYCLGKYASLCDFSMIETDLTPLV